MKRKRTYGKNPRPNPKDNGEAQGIERPEGQDEMSLDSEDDFEGFPDDNDGREDDPNDSGVEFDSAALKRHAKRVNHTKDELAELERNSSSFQSSFFKLQLDELLAEARVKYDKMQKVEKVLHQLKDIIMNIPTSQEQLLHSFESEMRNNHAIHVPFPTPAPSKDALYKFMFQAPTSLRLVGSYALKTAARGADGITIDIAVTMPDTIFQEKDFIDHRYFYKKASYLASLAAAIKSSALNVSISFGYLHDDERSPVLILSSAQDGTEFDFSKSHARIRLLPSISRTVFKPSKLVSSRSSIRSSPNTPTPLYNAAIMEDSLHHHFLSHIYNAIQSCTAVIDASLLGRIWLRQRGFTGSYLKGGFGAFEWTWFLVHLVRGTNNGRDSLSPGLSSFQLFRGALNSLAVTDRVENEEVTCKDTDSGFNVFRKMTPSSYRLLQHEAKRTLYMLSNSPDDVFNAIFTTNVDRPQLRYDFAALITVPHSEGTDVDSPCHAFHSIKHLTSILQRGLKNRVTLISITAPDSPSISIASSKPIQPTSLHIGLLVDPELSRALVDHGPPASDSAAAAAFRSFWGEKAELRRFHDGSILESVVWPTKSVDDRYVIVKRIVAYVIARHVSAGVAGDLVFLTPNLYPQLLPPPEVKATYVNTEKNAFQMLSSEFGHLVRSLQGLKDMPLGISSVVPVGEGLTETSVYSPYPQGYTKLVSRQAGSYNVPIHGAVLRLEGSGKWPDDLRAIQKVKIGLLLHISRQLEASNSISVHVGLENPDLDIANQGFLDVVLEHGYAFRLRIQHDPNHREAYLLERALKNKSLPQTDRAKYETALRLYQTDFIQTTEHAQALHALNEKFFFLSNSIRLVKKWIAAHMLTPHISPRAIELIVCHVFLHPHPWSTPATAEAGFLRTLNLLATWDWRKDPLVVDLNESMNSNRHEGLVTAFEAFRKQDPGIVNAAWSIYSTYDSTGSCWTRENPAKIVAARVTVLARSSLAVISKDAGNVKQIFTTPLTDYDFLIHLKKDYTEPVTGFKNLRIQSWKDVLVDFDAVQKFLRDLESSFGDAIFWFYDGVAGSVIAALWNPHVVASRPWKIRLGYSTIPLAESSKDDKPLVTLNKQAVLAEITRLGHGLIAAVSSR